MYSAQVASVSIGESTKNVFKPLPEREKIHLKTKGALERISIYEPFIRLTIKLCHSRGDLKAMKTETTTAAPTVDQQRLVLLLNEAYVFLGMPHKSLNPWRVALDEWQAKVEKETGWNHFDEVQKYEQNDQLSDRHE